ncbi:MAG: NAD-binding protein [Anaerolineales bacterium]|nr:NAD-binding protein [Anaerolineales bacterium]
MTVIGFIGLGVMGKPMACNVSRAYKVLVYDLDPERVQQTLAEKTEGSGSLHAADSVGGVGASADIVILSLPGSPAVRRVVQGVGGLAECMRPGSIVIDTSTTEPAVIQELHGLLAESGVEMLDAPVSGGERGAIDASLSIMAGGSEPVFQQCREVLNMMGSTVVHVGDIGMGEVAKLINNLIVGATFAVVAEGFALGVRSGLDPAVLYEAIRNGWAGSRVLDVSARAMLERNFTPGGTVDIHWKDLGYALSLASAEDVPTPITAMTYEVFKAARAAGKGASAQPAIIQLWEDLLKLQVGG